MAPIKKNFYENPILFFFFNDLFSSMKNISNFLIRVELKSLDQFYKFNIIDGTFHFTQLRNIFHKTLLVYKLSNR